MRQEDVIKILKDHKAVISDTHVVYTSGRHGNAYINKDALYPDTNAISLLCQAIAEHFKSSSVDVVAAPAIGGVILSQWVAHHLSEPDRNVMAVYAEKNESGSFEFRRGYDRLIEKKKILVVEDILTTGGSLREVISSTRGAGGIVVGASAICNRGGITADQVGNPPNLHVLAEISLESWEEDSCPLCKQGIPINIDVGKGREFIQRKRLA